MKVRQSFLLTIAILLTGTRLRIATREHSELRASRRKITEYIAVILVE